jgi:hypothetical protein
MPRTWLYISVLVMVPAAARADREPDVANRPAHFSGAAGVYRISARAAPTELAVEDPLILTITIQGTVSKNNSQLVPRRLKMRDFANLDPQFQVDDLPEKDSHPDAETWNFVYRLRPRSTQVDRVPRLRFVYWNAQSDTFQTAYSSSIPLRVKPRPAPPPPEQTFQMPGDLAAKYPLATGPAVLAQHEPEELPGPVFLIVLFAAPPVLCLAGSLAWLRWFPDAAHLAGRRRSRAARRGLKRLRSLSRALPARQTADRVVAIIGDYLRERLELAAAEPTSEEVTTCLEEAGIAPVLAGQFANLLDACAATRFAPDALVPRTDLAGEAARLIRQLEAEPCLAETS